MGTGDGDRIKDVYGIEAYLNEMAFISFPTEFTKKYIIQILRFIDMCICANLILAGHLPNVKAPPFVLLVLTKSIS